MWWDSEIRTYIWSCTAMLEMFGWSSSRGLFGDQRSSTIGYVIGATTTIKLVCEYVMLSVCEYASVSKRVKEDVKEWVDRWKGVDGRKAKCVHRKYHISSMTVINHCTAQYCDKYLRYVSRRLSPLSIYLLSRSFLCSMYMIVCYVLSLSYQCTFIVLCDDSPVTQYPLRSSSHFVSP